MMSFTRLLLILSLVLFPCRLLGYENWFERGLNSLEARRLDEAIDAFSRTLEIIPHDFEAYNNRGIAWFLKGRHDKAIEDFTEALTINSRLAQAYVNRGTLWFHKGQYDLALEDSTEALRINPRFFQAYCTRGAAWTQKGAYIQAIQDYEKARQLDPGDSQIYTPEKRPSAAVSTPENILYRNAIVLRMLPREIMSAGFPKYIEKLKSLIPLITPRIEDSIPPPQQVATDGSEKPIVREIKRLLTSPGKIIVKTDTPPQADIPAKEIEKPIKPAKKQTPAPSVKIRPKAPSPVTYPFTIHVYSFPKAEKAYRVALELSQKGHPVFTSPVQISGRDVWYRVLIGHFETRKDALAGAMELKRGKFRYALAMLLPFALQVEPFGSNPEPAAFNAAFGLRGYLPYTTRNGPENETPLILIGAFKTNKRAHGFAQKLFKEGFQIKVVRR